MRLGVSGCESLACRAARVGKGERSSIEHRGIKILNQNSVFQVVIKVYCESGRL